MEQIIAEKEGVQKLSTEDKKYIDNLIKEIEEEMKNFPKSETEIKNESDGNVDNMGQERIQRIEASINQLNPDKPEYPEELVALKDKLWLLENETTGDNPKETRAEKLVPTTIAEERLEQEQVVQDLIKKPYFNNTISPAYPNPKKEDTNQQLRIEQIIPLDKPEVEEQKPNPIPPIPQKPHLGVKPLSGERELPDTTTLSQNKEQQPIFSNEQLREAGEIRNSLYKYLSANSPAEWHQKPLENRDAVDRYINQAAEILSGKKSEELDTNDIQTARLFMFNNASEEIMKHPAFSTIKKFYNYQNSQGHSGVNPETIEIKNNTEIK
ncbi:hypothetical protein KJ973_02590 [Patescibacteria group bacterium]|nr:hypothetical protein [Patescibacteria group bacterium]MBU1519552.1 hypothetical protein [Patescibacteria group bacterium]MBU2417026.1 hypothetical protein [Patescibacteria group bacterium]MBU2460595.1 hypothetical protein [Patescibacteria group bacterium]